MGIAMLKQNCPAFMILSWFWSKFLGQNPLTSMIPTYSTTVLHDIISMNDEPRAIFR